MVFHAIFNRLIHQGHELVGFYAMIIPIAIIVRGFNLFPRSGVETLPNLTSQSIIN